MAEPGTAGYSQVQTKSAEKTHQMLYFQEWIKWMNVDESDRVGQIKSLTNTFK